MSDLESRITLLEKSSQAQQALQQASLNHQLVFAVRSNLTNYVVGGLPAPPDLQNFIYDELGQYADQISLHKLRKYAKVTQGDVLRRYREIYAELKRLDLGRFFDSLCSIIKQTIVREDQLEPTTVRSKNLAKACAHSANPFWKDTVTLRQLFLSDPAIRCKLELEKRECFLDFFDYINQKNSEFSQPQEIFW